ncbi:MAG: DMT family transporter [Caulobacterales bacterium]
MSLRDFALLLGVCLVWAASNVVSKVLIATFAAPPLFYAAARFAVVSLVMLPWLWPPPARIWRLAVVGLLMGGGNFALLFIGLKTATPSASVIVGQIGVPLTTLLSMIFLGEQVHWRRGVGMTLTLVGAVLVMWDPKGSFAFSTGLLFVAASAFTGSVGAVMMKHMEGVRPMQFQAWVAVSSLLPMALLSLLFEQGQGAVLATALWPFIGGVLFTALVVSVFAHTTYYGLIQRHDAGLLQPLTLMTPLFTIALGVLITHDRFDARMALGAAVTLLGVLIIAVRPNRAMPLLLLIRNRAQ